MPIAALPQAAIRAIGSLSVLSDSCSVVKELVENAIDAGATSIAVDISSNTLDVIQVKDNGLGIPPDDRELVCKRSCTSKIQTLDDLNNVGGTSLGFRGEALASLAEMCGGLVITTRVCDQAVAAVLSYGRNGELLSAAKTSHPVGTTVRVSGYLKPLPVRKQGALKCASKTATRIKDLLQAYAVSRPEVRFSLNILNSKENRTWVYAPNGNATITDALLKVVSSEVINSCLTASWPENIETDIDHCSNMSVGGVTYDSLRLVVVAPKPGCDFSKVGNQGQYISIDKRPLSASRGIAKDIVKLFKSYLRSHCSKNGGAAAPKHPFLCMQIHCPRGFYDANIEPSKDDVLFAEPASMLSAAEALFQSMYGDPREPGARDGHDSVDCSTEPSSTTLGEPLPGGYIETHVHSHPCAAQTSQNEGFISPASGPKRQSRPLHTLSGNNGPCNPAPTSSAVTPRQHFPRGISPWTLAKANRSLGSKENGGRLFRDPESHLLTPLRDSWVSPSKIVRVDSSPTASPDDVLPSPSTPETTTQRRNSPHALSVFAKPARPSTVRASDQNQDTPRVTSALDVWLTSQPSTYAPGSDQRAPSEIGRDELSEEVLADRFGSSRPTTATQETPSTTGYTGQVLYLDMPITSTDNRREEGQNFSTQRSINEALDFERRKKEAVQLQKRQFKKPGRLLETNNSPHENRFLAARTKLSFAPNMDNARYNLPDGRTESMFGTPNDDPRTRLIRHSLMQNQDRSSGSGLKIRRLPSNKLPLEMIPAGSAVHSLMVVQPDDGNSISHSSSILSKIDNYVSGTAEVAPGLSKSQSPDTLSLWAAALSRFIADGYREENSDDIPDPRLDLEKALQNHVATFADSSC